MKQETTGADNALGVSFCPVVAIGASAGGLEVFQQFFDRMPADSGMAFVLVQHLDPEHDTLMPELLSKHTSMPVRRVEDGLPVAANHVYVIGPKMSLGFEGCTLRVLPLKSRGDGKVIDGFFRSLAEDQAQGVVGIILSGTGADGTVGLRAIKEGGGLTIAQLPKTAKFDAMPRSAISTGCVDVVLPVEEMPARIVEYARHLNKMHHQKGLVTIQQEVVELLPSIFPILRAQTGHDFSRYKQSTLIRRIQRRMQLGHMDSATEYVKYLEEHTEEADALFKDLLIGVTQFFRDTKDFEALEKTVVPVLFEGKKGTDQVRVWVPGCATGEEAYTFAMLLAEHAALLGERPRIQVFATDLDAEALEKARKARYPAEIALELSPERLARFFKKVESGYEVADEIRELCIFSPHNLTKDPPFSRLDLLSCRNVLIYLEADLQKKLFQLFHYALNPSGYLFLGPSENIGSRSELFRPVDQKHRIFQRKPTMLHTPARVPVLDAGQVTRLQVPVLPVLMVQKEQTLARSIERVILEEYAPASVIINNQGEVLYFSGNTGKYLEPPVGVPNNKLVAMARKSLRLELRTVLHRAITTGKEAVRGNIRVKLGEETQPIDLVVRPLTELGNEPELYIVLFRELIPSTTGGRPAVEDFGSLEHPVIKQMESELRTTKEDLQTTIEELETSNEELKSANEELLSMNEELQSANEELQTSKEEVQSANEELNRKIEEAESTAVELRRAHEERGRLAAIVESSEDAIIGKTLDGVVTSWNGAAERIFGYSAEEMIGQSITKVIPPERLNEENYILGRLRRGERIQHYETERLTKSGLRIFVSLMSSPIRDPQGMVIGASKIARDITERKKAEEARLLLAAVIDSSDDAIITKTLDGIISSWNRAAEKIYGYTAKEVIGKPVTILMPADRQNEEPAIIERLKRGEKIDHYETVRRRKDGRLVDISITVSPIRDSSGRIIGASKIARDITGRKQAEEARFRLASVVESSDDAIISKTLDGIVTTWNKAAERLFGYTAEEMIGKSITTLFPPDRLDEEPRVLAHIRRGERLEHFETVRRSKDGQLIDISLTVSPIKDELGRVIGASKIARDVTERKQAEEMRSRLAAVVESSDDAIISKNLDGIIASWNKGAERVFGYRAEEVIGKHITILFPPDRLEEESKVIAHIRRGEPLEHYETVRKTKDGRLVDISLTVSPIKDALGRVIGASKIARDITEHKKAEQSLRHAAERLQLALGAGGLGDWNWEAATDLLRISDRASDIFGLPRGTRVTWSKMRENLHEEDRENARLAVERALSEHSLYRIEYRVNRPSGEIKWIAAMGRGTYGNDGTVLGMVGMVQDITERRNMEESLREESRILELLNETGKSIASQLELQSLLQQVTDAATKLSGAKFGAFFYNTVNEQGESFVLYTISGAPREAFEKFGLPRATPIFKPTFHAEGVVRSDDITQDPRYGKMAPHHGMPRGHLPVRSYLAVSVVSRSGEVIGGLFFGHPERAVFTERSERLVAGVAAQAAVAIDNARLYKTAQTEIAERQRIAEDLQKAREELSRHAEDLEGQVATRTTSLREAVAQLEEFSYTVSHDLRAPLRAIGGYNEILRKDYGGQLPEEAQSYLAKIGRSTARMERLVHDVLTMSRVARAELKVHPISLQEFIEEIVEQHPAMQSPAAEVQIQTPHRVMADDTSLSQAIGNLLSNAVKFMSEGTKPVVMVRSEQAGQEVRLWIEDNGIGIPEKHRDKLFVMFQRLSAKQQYEGTGIGLAIVRKAVERMGGTVGIEANQSQGSRFWLQLKGAE